MPKDLQDLFNTYGGKMKPTWGVPVSEIQKAIPLGVRKVNIDTDLRLAMTGTIRKNFAENPENFDPRTYLKPATALMTEVCKERFEAFRTAGKASKIRTLRLPEMAKRYAAS
ncbi:hypothetical protein N182_12850 [Sinorhizobium sp. GL2]|nr:hypothetical protein N182_12850 [Sinorhizobium sp. GL2]